MRDRFFYPLLLVVLTAILGLALIPGVKHTEPPPEQIVLDGYTLAGLDLQKLTAAPGTFVRYIDGQSERPLLAVLSSNVPRKIAVPSPGIFGTLGPNYEEAFGARTLKITIVARAGRENALEEFKVQYFTDGIGSSGWRNFTLSNDFQDYSFTYKPKPPKGNPGNDFIGIWPGDEGKKETMELESIRIVVVD